LHRWRNGRRETRTRERGKKHFTVETSSDVFEKKRRRLKTGIRVEGLSFVVSALGRRI
jgi:hypothetical protein